MDELSDDIFEEQFRTCQLDPVLLTHEAHLRLAYIHISKYGEARAIQNLCLQIGVFDRTHGEGIKYHETITVVAVKIVQHFMNRTSAVNFDGLLKEFPRLKTNFKDLINQHYSLDLFKHPTAKIEYLEPDLSPFD
ncbi:hypothetical protein JYT25_00200 [bacterium AH-315-C20]|nr:hypothetical protein [bacterium AH-315-C20]